LFSGADVLLHHAIDVNLLQWKVMKIGLEGELPTGEGGHEWRRYRKIYRMENTCQMDLG